MDPAGDSPPPPHPPPSMQPPSMPPIRPPQMPPPAFARPVTPSLYRQAFRIVSGNRRTMMLPLLFTTTPVTLLFAATFYILYARAYPEASFGEVNAIQDDPKMVVLVLLLSNGIHWLFTLVGLAATAVAANGIITGQPKSVSESLDPAFTRMGGLLALGFTYYALLAVSIVLIPLLFLLAGFAFAIHCYIIEGLSFTQALGASWRIAWTKFLSFLGVLLVFAGIIILATFVLAFVVSIISMPFVSEEITRDEQVVLASMALGVGAFLAVPILSYFMTAMTLYYVRVKKGMTVA